MLPNVGTTEMIILFVIVLIIFGPKSLPKIGQAFGKGIREFKDAARGLTDMDDDDTSKQTPSSPSPQVSQTNPTATQSSESNSTTEHHA